MKGEKMLDAVGCVDADLIEMAEKAGKKNAVRNAVLRYGAIAASLVLVMGGVFLAGEYISNDPPIISGEVSETKEPDESSGETVETVDLNSGASETDITETDHSNNTEIPQGNGGNDVCTVHHIDYHTYDQCLTHYVGYDLFREWFDKYSIPVDDSPNGCRYPNSNIYEFIHYFDVPQDVLIKFYNEFSTPDYNIELLYDGTAEDVDQYYRSISDAQKIERIKRSNFEELKYAIRLNNIDTFPEIMHYSDYSLIEMMLMTDTPVEFIYDRIERKRKKYGEGIYGSQYEYDFSMLNELDRSELEEAINEHSAFYLDCVFCGIEPYETRYEQQVAKNKAAS